MDSDYSREGLVAFAEPEGVIDEQDGKILSRTDVLMTAIAPFEEQIQFSLLENTCFFMTDEKIQVYMAPAAPKKAEPEEDQEDEAEEE